MSRGLELVLVSTDVITNMFSPMGYFVTSERTSSFALVYLMY